MTDAVTTEKTRAEGAEVDLTTAVEGEISRATAAEVILTTTVDNMSGNLTQIFNIYIR